MFSFIDNIKIRFHLNKLNSEMLIIEQHKSLARQMPFLYGSVIVSTICIVLAFYDAAPSWVFMYGLPALTLFSLLRLHHWSRIWNIIDTFSLEERKKDIAIITVMAPVLCFGYSLFGISLVHFGVHAGTPYQQSLPLVLIWATVIMGAYSLSVVPIASIAMVIATSIPAIFAFNNSGLYILSMMSVGFAVLSVLTIYILLNKFRAFSNLLCARKNLEEEHEKVKVLANTDPLTGLANRRKFRELLENRVMVSARTEGSFAVCILDLDSFKHINDHFNHTGGDKALIEVGRRLEKVFGKNGVVARLSSDEFHMQTSVARNADEAEKLGASVHDAFRAPILIDDNPVHISASVGIALYPEAGITASQLVKHAAQAQNKAKRCGGGKTRLYTSEYEQEILERSKLEIDLKSAIRNDELEVYFQPIVDLQTGKFVSFEALARWNHPVRGFVSPDDFIQLAEEKGLIEHLTVNLLRKMATVAATWPSDIKVAFNLSAEQVCNPNFALTILTILNEAGLPPNRFEVELTESAIMADMEKALLTINNLKEVGVSISLDDFGTGYSSLSQIRDIPLDKLKIDKSFIDDVCTSPKNQNIFQAILRMCSILELKTVIEGIERKEQLEAICAAGGDLGQGYLFSRPVPASQLTDPFTCDLLKDVA